MIIEMISTGDEVLTGFVTNSNAAFLGQELLINGLQISKITTIGDNKDDLEQSFLEASLRADIVIVNGGLGPTTDDLTREVVSNITKTELVLNNEALEDLKKILAIRGRELNQNNLRQVMLPSCASIIKNPHGTACGFLQKINKAVFFFTPGVPFEFKFMIREHVIPKIKELFKTESKSFVKIYNIFGITESAIAEEIEKYKIPSSMTIGYRACTGYLEIKIITNNYVDEDYQITKKIIYNIIKPYLLCEDELNISKLFDYKSDKNDSIAISINDSVTKGQIMTKMADTAFDITYIANKQNNNYVNKYNINGKYQYNIEIKAENNEKNLKDKYIRIIINDCFINKECINKCYQINNKGEKFVSEITSLLAIDIFRRITNNLTQINYQSFKEI